MRANETESTIRKLLPIIYLIDVSGSMYGDKIEAVNEAMPEAVQIMREISNTNILAEVAGNVEGVISLKNLTQLKNLIRAVSVRASEIDGQSRLATNDDASLTKEISDGVQEELSDSAADFGSDAVDPEIQKALSSGNKSNRGAPSWN